MANEKIFILCKDGLAGRLVIGSPHYKPFDNLISRKSQTLLLDAEIDVYHFKQCVFVLYEYDSNDYSAVKPIVVASQTNINIEFVDCSFVGFSVADRNSPGKIIPIQLKGRVNNCSFKSCYFSNLAGGISFNSADATLLIKDCSFEGCMDFGVDINSIREVVIQNNTFNKIGKVGLRINVPLNEISSKIYQLGLPSTMLELRVEDNEFNECSDGIRITGEDNRSFFLPFNLIIKGNTLTGTAIFGLYIDSVNLSDISIVDNKIRTTGYSGALIINTKATNPINFTGNEFFANHRLSLGLENTIICVEKTKFSNCVTGIWINFNRSLRKKMGDNNELIESLLSTRRYRVCRF